MASSEIIEIPVPQITSATFSTNPADMNTKTVLSISVAEITITLEPYYYYSGDLYAGEV